MKREFQIRLEDEDGMQLDCLCFSDLAEAKKRYQEMCTEETEGVTYHLELLEVLEQEQVYTE